MRTSLLILPALAACQTAGDPVPLEDVSAATSSVYCARLYECYSPPELREMFPTEPFTDEPSCVAWMSSTLDEYTYPAVRGVYEGTVVYRGERLTACLSTIADASCSQVRRGLEWVTLTCESAFECVRDCD